MLQLNIFTEKSKKCFLLALKMSEDCCYKYLEPQVLLAAIVNEGRDMVSFILRYLHVDKIDFCKKINNLIVNIQEKSQAELLISPTVNKIIAKSKLLANESGCELIPLELLFLAMIMVPSSVKDLFTQYRINKIKLSDAVNHYRQNSAIQSPGLAEANDRAEYPTLTKYARNLILEAQNGVIHRAIGRDKEIRRIINILARQTKNNPMLVGEPGTGKTAIVEGLAHRIIQGDVPQELMGVRLYSLDLALLVAGARYVGDFEERVKNVMQEVVNSDGKIILFIDEIHLLIGEGRTDGAMDAANIMKPELARGKIKVIGATTFDEYQKYIEQDKAFERRFQKVTVEEPDEEACLTILRGIKMRLEEFHNLRIKDEALKAALKLSLRYIQDRYLPDKAIDLLDEACSRMKIARSTSPPELDAIRRQIMIKEIECESLRRDNAESGTIVTLQEEIANLKEEANSLHAKWQTERQLLKEIQNRRNEIERLQDDKRALESQGIVSSIINISMRIKALEEEITPLLEALKDNPEKALLKPELDEVDVMQVITEATGIPVAKLSESESEKLANLENYLEQSVIGQDEAKMAVANAIRRSRLGFGDENKPIGSFLFMGTTGVGKTELCKALSEFLFDGKDALIRLDMSEYQQEHEVSKLFGAPPGYLGHEEGGQLTEAVRRKPYAVILLDEIEKAHPKVFETLLQVLDDGRMTDGQGRTITFKNTLIIMTSNLGHQVIYATLQGEHRLSRRIGFHNSDPQDSQDNLVTPAKIAKAKAAILTELKAKISPEFINRIDEIVMFLPLTQEDVKQIVQLQITALKTKLANKGLKLEVQNTALDFLAKVGFQPEYGARPVKRAINSFLLDDLSLNILNGLISEHKPIIVTANQEGLVFKNSE